MRRQAGFTLLELLAVLAIVFCVGLFSVTVGFGMAFAFSQNLLVPWLGVSAAYAHAATLAGALALTGVGAIVVLVVLIFLGVTVGVFGSKRRRS